MYYPPIKNLRFELAGPWEGQLSWQPYDEEGVESYLVYRSTDEGRTWDLLEMIDAAHSGQGWNPERGCFVFVLKSGLPGAVFKVQATDGDWTSEPVYAVWPGVFEMTTVFGRVTTFDGSPLPAKDRLVRLTSQEASRFVYADEAGYWFAQLKAGVRVQVQAGVLTKTVIVPKSTLCHIDSLPDTGLRNQPWE